MTTSAVIGKNMSLSIQGDLMAEARSFTLHLGQSLVDVTSKDSDSWGDFLVSRKEWTISFNGLYVYTDDALKFLICHLIDGTPATLTVIITMPETITTFYGSAVLESMDLEGPAEEALTYSGSLKGQGALEQSLS